MTKSLVGSKVLVVDEDIFFKEILKKCLEQRGIGAIGVETVDQAIRAMELYNPDAVVVEASTAHSESRLWGWIKSNCPDLPVVVMAAADSPSDPDQVQAMGAFAFLRKPFSQDDLIRILATIVDRSKGPGSVGAANKEEEAKAESESDEEYMKVSVEDFITGSEIKFPIYLRIASSSENERFVKLAHTGEDLSLERVRAYRQKGVDHLYMLREDYTRYVDMSVAVVKVAANSRISREKKGRLLRHTMELVEQQLFSEVISREAYAHAATLVEVGVKLLSGTDAGFALLQSLREISDELYAHSTAVSLLSSLLVKEMGWRSPRTIVKVSIAGMLHDIGKKQLPRELALKRTSQMTPAEIDLYETHCHRAVEILSELDYLPSDVIQAVAQHHERTNGLGFPGHLTNKSIYPLAKVLAVADEFCKIHLGSNDRTERDPARSMHKLMELFSNGLDPEPLLALHRVFHLTAPEWLSRQGRAMPR